MNSQIDLSRFNCGNIEINQWANKKAKKFHSSGRQKIYCFSELGSSFAKGIMALSLSHYDSSHFPRRDDHDDFIPDNFPAIYIDYIGVQRSEQGNQIGSALLVHALKIGLEVHERVPLYAIALRSLNDESTKLYGRYGFVHLPNSGNPPLMILPIWLAIDLFSA